MLRQFPERKLLHWGAAVGTAMAAHLLLAAGYLGMNSYGAAGEGKGGIEIGLGMLGNLGESSEDTDAGGGLESEAESAAAPAPAEAAPAPEESPAPPVPPEQPAPVRQLAEITVPRASAEEVVARNAAEEPDTPPEFADPDSQDSPEEAARQASNGSASASTAGGPDTSAPGTGGAGSDSATRRRSGEGLGDSPGAGGSPGRMTSYVALLARQVNRHKHYPMAARRAREEGTVTLSLIVRRDGSVADGRISQSSGSQALDAAVLRMLERAQPLPAFPASMTQDEIRVDFPISFSLQAL